jgi:hypothetical protein
MSVNTPLLDNAIIEPDDPTVDEPTKITTNPVVLVPTNLASSHDEAESGLSRIYSYLDTYKHSSVYQDSLEYSNKYVQGFIYHTTQT